MRLNNIKKICGNYDYCHVEMPKEDEKILRYNPGEKSVKAPFIIPLDIECILPKEQSCQNNPENSYKERKAKHEPSGWAIAIKCSFDATKNKLVYYRGTDCIKNLSENLADCSTKIFNYEEQQKRALL